MVRKATRGNKLDWTNATKGKDNKDKPRILPTRDKPIPKGGKKDNNKPASKKFQKGITCHYYKREGHIKSKCQTKAADKAKKSSKTLPKKLMT
jgi:hypothetical protein